MKILVRIAGFCTDLHSFRKVDIWIDNASIFIVLVCKKTHQNPYMKYLHQSSSEVSHEGQLLPKHTVFIYF